MSNEMSWHASASRIKGYLTRPEIKNKLPTRLQLEGALTDGRATAQSLKEWAGQKIKRGFSYDDTTDEQKVWLFPGWATRRYRKAVGAELEGLY
jgi:hypothetical protein